MTRHIELDLLAEKLRTLHHEWERVQKVLAAGDRNVAHDNAYEPVAYLVYARAAAQDVPILLNTLEFRQQLINNSLAKLDRGKRLIQIVANREIGCPWCLGLGRNHDPACDAREWL